MNKYRELLQQALQVAAAGDEELAVRKLDEGAHSAMQDKEGKWSALLFRNAGLLYEKKGDLELARDSYQMALACSKVDPYLLYALADVCRRLGDNASARHYFSSCFELASTANDHDLVKKLSEQGFGPR